MTRTDATQIGTIYIAAIGDDLSAVDLGDDVRLGAAHRRHRGSYVGRAWYLQSERGMLSFEETGDAALAACEQFLADHGYRPTDDFAEWYTRRL